MRGFCYSSTHNSTSASESLLPLAITVIYTPLLEEFHRDTVSRVYFNSGTPFASDWCVRRTRDCDFFSVSYVVLLILHLMTLWVPVESNHPNLRALSTLKNTLYDI